MLKHENESSLIKCIFVVDYNILKQGCGAGTEISGCGSSSRHLKFFAQAPASKWFGPL